MISVLYVDYEPALLDVSKQYLERGGEFHVDTSESAGEALSILSHKTYDTIVSDYQMPVIDGIVFLKKLRESGNCTPFIIFTGKGREEVAIEALNSGADFYLQKVGDPRSQFAELTHKIKQAVSRRKAEDGLLVSEERYRALAESANDMIYITDPDGVVLYANTLCAEMFRTTPDTLVGKKQEDLFSADIARRHREGIRALIERGTPGSIEEHLSTPAGDFWISVNNTPLRDKDGKITSVLGIARDITRQKQVEDSLRFSYKKLISITSAIRHDINNKLTIISGYMQLMKLDSPGTKCDEYLPIMTRAVSDISKLLKFTKEYEKLGVGPAEWLSVPGVFRRAAAEISLGATRITSDTSGVEVLADVMLERAFAELVDNAIRHGGKVTDITARYEIRGSDLILILEDNGVGVPADQKIRIFSRGSGKNTGLGLFFTREILSFTGLEITESGETGKGARFEIRVPAGKFRLAEKETTS